MTYRRPGQRRLEDHQVDDWLMTYADMITLLVCFFAVFLSVSVPKTEAFKEARSHVLERFSDNPDEAVIVLRSPKPSTHGELPFPGLPSIVGRNPMAQTGGPSQGQGSGDGATGGGSEPLVPTGPAPRVGAPQMAGQSQGQNNKPAPGDRLITIDIPSAAFFTSGSASLSDEGKALIKDIMEKYLTEEKSRDYLITIEGHTDDVPINTLQFPSNWELSTARAAAVARFLIEQGIKPERLSASGYAYTFPKVPNRDELGKPIPGNQAQNRRVVIKLEKIEREE